MVCTDAHNPRERVMQDIKKTPGILLTQFSQNQDRFSSGLGHPKQQGLALSKVYIHDSHKNYKQ